MSRFRSQFKRTGAVSLLSQFGEDIIYYPQDAGSGRTIKAIVTRNVEVVDSGSVGYATFCRVVDDATLGISSAEINDARDAVMVAAIEGGDLEKRQLTLSDDSSNGMVRFRLR